MKVGMAKAYRVAPPALECLKVETNIVDAKEGAPESEAGRRQKGWALSQEFEEHLCVGLITTPLKMGYVQAVDQGQPLFRVGPAIYGHDCSVDYLDHIAMASPDDIVCVWGGKRLLFWTDADRRCAAAPRGASIS